MWGHSYGEGTHLRRGTASVSLEVEFWMAAIFSFFLFYVFQVFNNDHCLTSTGKINLNKLKTKQNKRWLVWQRYVCNKTTLQTSTNNMRKQSWSHVEKRAGWWGRVNPNRLWLGPMLKYSFSLLFSVNDHA